MSRIQKITVDLERVVKNLPHRGINTLTPLIEGIVNSIDSIDERKKLDPSFSKGEIQININKLKKLSGSKENSRIDNVEIIDNGIGFTNENYDSFNELHSSRKIDIGGKGFGRITYLKYFKEVNIDSLYIQENNLYNRTFKFGYKGISLISNDKLDLSENSHKTKVTLKYPNDNFINTLNIKGLTLARKISEHLLGFLIDEQTCPIIRISIIGDGYEDTVILNDYIKGIDSKIETIGDQELKIIGVHELFQLYVFKFYYPENQKSSINLIAHNRLVGIPTSLDKYIPEFKEEFYDEISKANSNGTKKENYVIKIYVKGNYLNDHVNTERTGFNFIMSDIREDEIEEKAIDEARKFFPKKLKERKLKKIEKIENIVNVNFPWHKTLLKDGIHENNINKLPYHPTEEDVDLFFEKLRFNKEGKARSIVRGILEGDFGDDIYEKVSEIEKELLELNKSELVHYVSLRKVILDLYQKFISLDSDQKYPKEEKIHNLVFPMQKNNMNLDYDKHNLWLIDETLVFSDYITSDKAIIAEDGKKTEPDMLVFRDGKDKYSPVYIIEFKRPGRKAYSDDPLTQILNYAKRLRKNNEITIDGRPITVVPETPIYGYFIGDITKKIRDSIEINDGITMESGESYYGYHKNFNVYYSLYSFDYIYKNSEQRNKVFFDKLGIDIN